MPDYRMPDTGSRICRLPSAGLPSAVLLPSAFCLLPSYFGFHSGTRSFPFPVVSFVMDPAWRRR